MMRLSRLLLLVGALAATAAFLPPAATAGGPWRGQIVDAETGQPLEGVVVLFYWIKYTGSWAGWAGGEFHDSAEVVTDRDGRFVVPSRRTLTLVPWKKVARELVIFKPGYGPSRFRGATTWQQLPLEKRQAQYDEAWKQFEGDGVVIELPSLKTREERLSFLSTITWSLVPLDRTTRLREALRGERTNLGLPAKKD